MGWVSSLEDVIERLDSALHMLQADSKVSPDRISEARKVEVAALLDQAQAIVLEAHAYLELATDPAVELARALEEARNEASSFESRLLDKSALACP